MKYQQSTLYQDKGKGNNWYVIVTVPLELRPLLKNQKQKKKSTKTTDIRIAKDKQREIEAIIYQTFDKADSSNHPLIKVADELQKIIFKEIKFESSYWFNADTRMNCYNTLRDETKKLQQMNLNYNTSKFYPFDDKGNLKDPLEEWLESSRHLRKSPADPEEEKRKKVINQDAFLKTLLMNPDLIEYHESVPLEKRSPYYSKKKLQGMRARLEAGEFETDQFSNEEIEISEEGKQYTEYWGIASRIPKISQLAVELEVEFAKVSSEKFAPKKRSKTFREARGEYLNSSSFEKISRIKTQDDYKNRSAVFMEWAGNITLDDIDMKLGSDFVEALCKKDSTICKGGASNGVVKKYMTPLKNIFQLSLEQGHIKYKPWTDLKIADKGRPPQDRLTFSDYHMMEIFKLDLSKQERLLMSILASTGCRLDEAALLEWPDIKEQKQEGQLVQFADLNRINAVLKNKSAKRHLIFIPQVWAMFPQQGTILNKAEPERIFTYKKDKDGKAQNKASRACMKQINKVIKDPRYVTHSLRHKFVSLCRGVNMDTELRNFIVGQDIGKKNIGANYGEEHHVKVKLENMAKIDWSFLTPTT